MSEDLLLRRVFAFDLYDGLNGARYLRMFDRPKLGDAVVQRMTMTINVPVPQLFRSTGQQNASLNIVDHKEYIRFWGRPDIGYIMTYRQVFKGVGTKVQVTVNTRQQTGSGTGITSAYYWLNQAAVNGTTIYSLATGEFAADLTGPGPDRWFGRVWRYFIRGHLRTNQAAGLLDVVSYTVKSREGIYSPVKMTLVISYFGTPRESEEQSKVETPLAIIQQELQGISPSLQDVEGFDDELLQEQADRMFETLTGPGQLFFNLDGTTSSAPPRIEVESAPDPDEAGESGQTFIDPFVQRVRQPRVQEGAESLPEATPGTRQLTLETLMERQRRRQGERTEEGESSLKRRRTSRALRARLARLQLAGHESD